jgi:hypothetical protein
VVLSSKGIDTLPEGRYITCGNGAVAQLGERLNGIQEVVGSIPISSTLSSIMTTFHGDKSGSKKSSKLNSKYGAANGAVSKVCTSHPSDSEPASHPITVRPTVEIGQR